MRPAAALLALACAGCAAAAPTPAPEGPPQAPPAEAPEAPAPVAEAPPADPLPEGLTLAPPAAIAQEQDEVARAFACMEFNHVSLLVETDRRDPQAVARRLGELEGARGLCDPVIERLFGRFPPFVDSYRQEWGFYTRYFALTLDASSVHNLQTFCGRLGRTTEAAQSAARQARAYHRWLSAQLQDTPSPDPYLATMLKRATEKVSGLTAAATALQQQQRRECP